MRRWPRAAALCVVLGLAASCGDALSVEALAGAYPLARVNRKAPPQLVDATANCDSWIESGELNLDAESHFMLSLRGHVDCTRSGGPVQDNGWDFSGTYTISGTTLRFGAPAYPSGTIAFEGVVDLFRQRIVIADVAMDPSLPATDLEFRR